MAAVAFDTYKMIKNLRAAGFTDSQAEAVSSAVQEAGSAELSNLATKAELKAEIAEVKADIAEVRAEVAAVKSELKAEIAEVRTEVVATKAELKAEIAEVRTEVVATKAELKADIAEVRADMRLLEQRMIVKLGGMLVIITGNLLTAIRYLPLHP